MDAVLAQSIARLGVAPNHRSDYRASRRQASIAAIPNSSATSDVEAASSRIMTRQDGASTHHWANTRALENEIWNRCVD
jgi:hypothetical protein